MPTIRLGGITSNYRIQDNTFILSAVIPATCSYETPVIIRTLKELNAYFGEFNYPYRDYYIYLLSNNIALYLYRPISTDIPRDEYGVDHIDESYSWNNRDTIRIWNKDYAYEIIGNRKIQFSIDHCSPSYRKVNSHESAIDIDYSNNEYYKYQYSYESLGDNISRFTEPLMDSDKQSLAFRLDFTKVTYEDFFSYTVDSKGIRQDNYIIIPSGRQNYQIWFCNDSSIVVPPISVSVLGTSATKVSAGSKTECVDKVVKFLEDLEFKVIRSGDIVTFYSTRPEEILDFYELPNLVYTNDFRLSNDILSEGTEKIKQLEFYSKTTGPASRDISVTISRLPQEKYLIEISRYDYQEYFEVKLDETPDMYGNIIPIESVINTRSKLVTCRYFETNITTNETTGISESMVPPLPEGTYYLRGAEREYYTDLNYKKSLEVMKDTTIMEDFFMVDNLLNWCSYESGMATEGDMKIIYDYVYTKNCQALISTRSFINNVDPDNIITFNEYDNAYYDEEGGMYSNRMIYFYGDLAVDYIPVPQYYVFLKGIFTDTYSVDETGVISLMNSNDQELKDELTRRSINYLSYNNMEYYYDNLDGKSSISTILMRYCISRVTRIFLNNKWKLLGMSPSKLSSNLANLITYIKSSIYLISDINVSTEVKGQNLRLMITLLVKGLVQNNISLDITLNYN